MFQCWFYFGYRVLPMYLGVLSLTIFMAHEVYFSLNYGIVYCLCQKYKNNSATDNKPNYSVYIYIYMFLMCLGCASWILPPNIAHKIMALN